MAMPASAPAGRRVTERGPDLSRRPWREARRRLGGWREPRGSPRRRCWPSPGAPPSAAAPARRSAARSRSWCRSRRRPRSPRESWKARTAAAVCLPKIPVTGSCVWPAADQMLLRPDDQVAAATALQHGLGGHRPVAGQRPVGRRAERRPGSGCWSPASPTSSAPARRSWRRSGGSAAPPCGPGFRRSGRAGTAGAPRAGCRGRCARRRPRTEVPIAFQYICGWLKVAPSGPKKTE